MKIKIKRSDIIAIIIIIITVILVIKYVNSGQENREHLSQNGLESIGIVYDFTCSKSRKFVEYEFSMNGERFTGGFQIRKGDLVVKIGDSIKILYDPNDYSNSIPFRDENGKIVKIYQINQVEDDSLLKKLID